MIRTVGALAASLCCGTGAAQSCGDALPQPRRTIESDGYTIAYTTTPARIPVDAHFVVDMEVCPRAGVKSPESIRVDANMPAQRHVMNYRAEVTEKGEQSYRAEGLLFHMPGRWDLTFDVASGGSTERLTDAIEVE